MVYDSDWTVSPPSLLSAPPYPTTHQPSSSSHPRVHWAPLVWWKIRCGVALQIWLGDLFMVIKDFTVVQSAELRL